MVQKKYKDEPEIRELSSNFDMGKLFGGGIILAVLLSCWDKIKTLFIKVSSLFICRYTFTNDVWRHGMAYTWDMLDNKKSLAPIYDTKSVGSGKDSNILIREMGFKNFRIIWFGKIPALVTIDRDCQTHVTSIKPFTNHEKIMMIAINYYNENYLTNGGNSSEYIDNSRFCTEYIRGTLNSKQHNSDDDTEFATSITGESTFDVLEQMDLGRRVNYTQETYRQFTTYTKVNDTLLENLYMTKEMTDMKNCLERWFEHKEWFRERSIQWKRGLLIHGEPGTGKTSLISALAEYFRVPLYIFDLATFTNADMERKWYELKRSSPCFVVFEDFDSVFDGRTNIYTQNAMTTKPLSFDCVLNVLDGAIKYDGVVTFITTNNINKIDSSLGGGGNTRPGRIDYVYEMSGISTEGKRYIAEKIFKGMDFEEDLIIKSMTESKAITPAQFKESCIDTALKTFNLKENVK